MSKFRKRLTATLLAIITTPILLVVLLAAMLYVPPIQRWAVRKAAEYASEKTGMQITLDEVRLRFPLDLCMKEVCAVQHTDTIVHAGRAIANLDVKRILSGEVGVNAIELDNGLLHTGTLIPSVSIDGHLEHFHIDADGVNLKNNRACIGKAILHGADVEIALHETEPKEDTTSTSITWHIGLDKLEIADSRLLLRMPGDSMRINTGIAKATLDNGDIDLARGVYKAKEIMLRADSARYDLPYTPCTKAGGIDPAHIAIDSICIQADSLYFAQDPMLVSCALRHTEGHERCGLKLEELSAEIRCTTDRLQLRGMKAETSGSLLEGDASMDFKAFTPHSGGTLQTCAKGRLAMSDVTAATGNLLPQGMRKAFGDKVMRLGINGSGNMDYMSIDSLAIDMPSVACINAGGHLANLLVTDSIEGNMRWDIVTRDLSGVRRWLGMSSIALPPTVMHANTTLRQGMRLKLEAMASQRNGRARLAMEANMKSMAYQAKAAIHNWQLSDWIPQSGLHRLDAQASVKGRGTDFLAESTSMEGSVRIDTVKYHTWNMGNVNMEAKLHRGHAAMTLDSKNMLLDMLAQAEATLSKRKLTASTFQLDLNSIDLYALHLAKDTMRASMKMHLEGSSDLRQTHSLRANASQMVLALKDTTYHPVDLKAKLDMAPDSIMAEASAGDLDMSIRSAHGLDSLRLHIDKLLAEIRTEADSLHLDQEKLRQMLPTVKMHLICGTKNPMNNILRSALGYSFNHLHFDLDSSPQAGLSGDGYVHTLNTGAVLLDTILWDITQDKEGVALLAKVHNGPKNKVVSFQSTMQARLTPTGTAIQLEYIDAKGKKGVDLGMEANVMPDGVRVHMTPLNPIIAYRHFTLNEDNYIELTRQGRLQALVDLLADDGTGLKLYSTPNNEALQDISLSLNNINMAELTSVLPYAPHLAGLLHGDIHYMQADSATTVSADLGIKKLIYEGTSMGDMGLNAIYFPNSDGSHHVDAVVTKDDNEIAMLAGKYWEQEGKGQIDAEATLESLPLSLANAFLPEGMVRLTGAASGTLSVTGAANNPIFTGMLATESMHVLADEYSIDLSIPDDTLRIKGSHLDLDRIEAYAAGNSPLTIDGYADFSQLDKIRLSVDVAAKNYKLIDAPQSHTAMTYGKVYVDMNARVWGTLDNLKVRGRLAVLGNTDVTYVLRDSPITVQDQLSDIVTFCDFSDTTTVKPTVQQGQSVDALIVLSVEQSAQVHCLLSEDGSDYVNLQGGGELTLTYDLENDIRLYGRYTIEQGVMRYSLMAIPLNDFQIQSGSYVEFTGDIENPTLGISASERVKASVTENNVPRNVAFDVGLALSQTLEDMGLTFTLEAPEDMTVQNELTAMSAEERGRVAVTMLVTGMYMTDNFNIKNGFSYANTLNAYLQSAINNIAGQALSTVDLSFGIENSTTATGGTTTDYSFSFRKRFWGNRVSLVLGGKVSSGSEAENNGQTIIDNVSLEYKLDSGSSRYVRIYYNRNYESLLEGELTEMGAGLVLRRRTNRLRDLFRFRKQQDILPRQGFGQQKHTDSPATHDNEQQNAGKAREE